MEMTEFFSSINVQFDDRITVGEFGTLLVLLATLLVGMAFGVIVGIFGVSYLLENYHQNSCFFNTELIKSLIKLKAIAFERLIVEVVTNREIEK